MSEYTPNTDEVFQGFYQIRVPVNGLYGTRLRSCVHYQIKHEITRAEFDRWLAQVKAEAWEEGFEASDKRCEEHGELDEFGKPHTCIPNPYRQGEEQ